MGEGDGDGGVVAAGPSAGVRRVSGNTVLHAWVVVVRGSVLLEVVRVVGVRAAQHQPPPQCGEARNWDIRDRGALHTAGGGLQR